MESKGTPVAERSWFFTSPLACGTLILNRPSMLPESEVEILARQHSIPRHKRLSRQSRLQAAPYWIAQYPSNNILRGYCKHFGVDFECALKELIILGVRFDAESIHQWRQSLNAQHEHRRHRREAQRNHDMAPNQEWDYFFVMREWIL